MTRRQKEVSQGEWALGDGYRERSTILWQALGGEFHMLAEGF